MSVAHHGKVGMAICDPIVRQAQHCGRRRRLQSAVYANLARRSTSSGTQDVSLSLSLSL